MISFGSFSCVAAERVFLVAGTLPRESLWGHHLKVLSIEGSKYLLSSLHFFSILRDDCYFLKNDEDFLYAILLPASL